MSEPRLLIEGVSPQLSEGRYPVKRLLGDRLLVGADVLKDGHDVLGARVCYRAPGDRQWRSVPMSYDQPTDRWTAVVPLDALGRWVFTIEAWKDEFATWTRDLAIKVEAGQDVGAELLEGAALLQAAAARAGDGTRAAVRRIVALLRDGGTAAEHRARAVLGPDVAALVAGIEPAHVTRAETEYPVLVDREQAGFAAWYEVFPRSLSGRPGVHGTFADLARHLPRIAALGFDVVYLPPIHPVGQTNRKGANNSLVAGPEDPGSVWAIGNEHGGHTAIEPALGTFADFARVVDTARALGLEIALDYALQCSPDHPWVHEHPDWFFVRPDGTMRYAENPPKRYEDIVPLDFWCEDRGALWAACRDVLLFWIAHGVRSFRVDNPHTKPFAFWAWLLDEVRAAHHDVVFLSEAFTRPKRMHALAKIGFTQSYTYFTWRNTPWELREYLTELTQTKLAEYLRGNFFTNTPDILHAYLQTGGRAAFLVRLVLAATLSPLYGIFSGFELCEATPLRPGSEEYLHSDKYELRARDFDAPGNLNTEIATVNRIRREHPALQRATNLSFHLSENERILFYRRAAPPGAQDLLIAVNLEPHHPQETMVHVPLEALGLGPHEEYVVHDLLTGERYGWRGVRNYVRLDPAERVAHVLRLERG